MEIIVLQHIKVEDPGYIKDLMLKDGVNLTTIELDEGLVYTVNYFSQSSSLLIVDNKLERSKKYFKKSISESA